MMDYVHEYSNYPNELINMRVFKDPDNSIIPVIQQIKNYKALGNYSAAAQLIKNTPEIADYMFSATDINRIIEEIYNTQLRTISRKQRVFYRSTDFVPEINDVWIL